MAKDRARDDRRTVGSHEKMMGGLRKAAEANVSSSTAQTWLKPQAVRSPKSLSATADRAYSKGLITIDERADERAEDYIKGNRELY